MVDIQSSTSAKMAWIKEFQDTEHVPEKRRLGWLKRQDLSFIRGFLCGAYSMIRVVKVWSQNELVIKLLLVVRDNKWYRWVCNKLSLCNRKWAVWDHTFQHSPLHLTFQNSPVCHFISKDTRDMNIYLIQTLDRVIITVISQSMRLQPRYLNDKPTEPDRDDRGQRTRIIEYNPTMQNNIVDWPEAAQKYSSYKEKVG